MTRLLQGINLHVIKRKFREKWIVHIPRRKKEQRDLEREFSEASEDFSDIEIL